METQYVAFEHGEIVVSGTLEATLHEVHAKVAGGSNPAEVLIFDQASGQQRDFDLRGDLATVLAAAGATTPKRGRGRTKLGVTAKEVTLLPRHWAWLSRNGRSPSATLRKLVDASMADDTGSPFDPDPLYNILSAAAGNLPGFEAVIRALYQGDHAKIEAETAGWPEGIRGYTLSRLPA